MEHCGREQDGVDTATIDAPAPDVSDSAGWYVNQAR
jgi:hypothetical protein